MGIEPTVAFAAGLQNQSFTIQGIEAFKVWAVMDSNHRSPKRGDLQSPAIAAMRPALMTIIYHFYDLSQDGKLLLRK